MTRLSVVVPCRDRPHLLTGCLDALAVSLTDDDEVVVVDAASRDGAVARAAAGVRCLRSEQGSASAARNVGWRAARGDLVAFVDDDCRPSPGWAAGVVAALADLDVVCGRVVGDGRGNLSLLEQEQPRDYGPATPLPELGHGANLAARRAALVLLGGWDERLGPGTPWAGGEDKELLHRAVTSGLRAGFRPDPVVVHAQWRNRRQVLRAEFGYARGAGALARRGVGDPTARAELRTAVRDLRAGYQLGALAGVARAVGVVLGRRA